MFGLIGMILPSIFGLIILEHIAKDWKLSKKNYVYVFSMLLLFSSIISLVISRFLFGVEDYVFECLSYYPMFFVKYVTVSLVVNFILAIIFILIRKYISIHIEVSKRETK